METGEIRRLIEAVEPLLEDEPQLVNHELGEFLVVGDTHGDEETTVNALKLAEREGFSLIFLGDYVDRGPRQVENMATLMEAKLSWRGKLTLLRGNHESMEINRWYGFMDVVMSRYGRELYMKFAQLFSKLPYAALIHGKIFCVHGGVAEGLKRIEDVMRLPKGELDPRHPIAFQLLWNDPCEDIEEFAPSWRGGGARLFGWRAFTRFMESNKLSLLLRAHEPQPEGYGELFGGKLKTIFSCRYYGITPSAALVREGNVERVVKLT